VKELKALIIGARHNFNLVWNPVKELKVYHSRKHVPAQLQWNPVKELKDWVGDPNNIVSADRGIR